MNMLIVFYVERVDSFLFTLCARARVRARECAQETMDKLSVILNEILKSVKGDILSNLIIV